MSKHYKGNVSKNEVVEFEVPDIKEQKLGYLEIESQLRHLLGEVLTIVDASYTSDLQRKAVKDLIKNAYSAKMSWVYELCGYPPQDNPSESLDSVDKDNQ